jgi:predicted enzyme related to lactoylglutathione lyase
MEVKVVWYPVKDFEGAKKFYGEVLGMKQTFAMGGWAEYSHAQGGVSIGLAKAAESGGSAPAEAEATIVLRVPDLDRARKELAGRGVKFEGEIEDIPGVVRLAAFRDVSGNRLQLAQVLTAE